MPSKRLNQKQKKRLNNANRDGYLAPPEGFGYPGRPIHRSNPEKLRALIRETALSIKVTPAEEASRLEFLERLDGMDSPELVKLLCQSGFKIVKHKELRVHVKRTDQALQASARLRTSAPIEERGTATVFTVNARERQR